MILPAGDLVFTGLVEDKASVESVQSTTDHVELAVRSEVVSSDAAIGDSISVNGCCLTIVRIQDPVLHFDAVPETMQRTNLGFLNPGDPVNLERAVKANTRLGGHYVTGHIDGVGKVARMEEHEEWRKMFFSVHHDLAIQMASKGSVAIDGVSLTLVDVDDEAFSVVLIPHTLQLTTLGDRRVGDRVNIETDLLAKYVQRQLESMNFAPPTPRNPH